MLVANLGQPSFTLSQSKKHSYTKASGNNGTSSGSTKTSQLLIPTTKSLCTTQQSIDSDNVIKALSVRITRDADMCQRSLQTSLITKIPTLNLNLNTVPPTLAHRKPELLHNRADSIRSEMCHFKPIRTVPTTPPRRYCSNMVRLPKVKRAITLNCDVKISSKKCSAVLRNILASSSHKSAFCYMGKITKKTSFLRSNNSKQINTTSTSTTSINTTSSRVRSSTLKEYPIIVSSDDELYPNDDDLQKMNNPKVQKTRLKESPSKIIKRTQPKREKHAVVASVTSLTKRIQKRKKSLKKVSSTKSGPITRRSVRLSDNTSVSSEVCSELLTEIKVTNQTISKKVTRQNNRALNKSIINDNSRLTTFSPRITRSARLKGIPIILNDGSQITYNKRSKKGNIL